MVVQDFEPFALEGNAVRELEVRFTPGAEGAAKGALRLRTRSGPLGAEGEAGADVKVRRASLPGVDALDAGDNLLQVLRRGAAAAADDVDAELGDELG